MTANWIDKAIGYVSPAEGLRRVRARAALDTVVNLRYEGARKGRRGDNWNAYNTSANAEIGPDLPFLRARSRDLIRNDPYAKKAVSVLVANVVGRGIRPKASTGDESLDVAIDAAFAVWCRECDADGQLNFYGLQRLALRSQIESGEVLARRRYRLAMDGLHVPMQIQILESDYIDSNRQWYPNEFNAATIAGVAFNELGVRKGYWLFPWHPGDVIKYVKDGFVSKLISADQITHLYEKDRPGQIRGVPWLAAVLTTMRDLGDYDEAERVRKKIEACLAVFVEQAEGAEGPTIAPTTNDVNSGLRIETMEPGMVEYLKPGEKIATSQPAAVGGYAEYLTKQERRIATGAGVMYEQLTGDLSTVNYSSYRAGAIEFRQFVEQFRELTFVPVFCDGLWRQFIQAAFVSGKLPIKAVEGSIPAEAFLCKWTPPAWMSVDPMKDEEADLLAVRKGRKTWAESVIETGGDPEERLDELQRQNKEFDARKLIVDTDPRNIDRARGAMQIKETVSVDTGKPPAKGNK